MSTKVIKAYQIDPYCTYTAGRIYPFRQDSIEFPLP